MPLFVGASSKAMPQAGIEYITDEKKAEITTVQNLNPGRNLAEQFTATAKLHGHYTEAKERKYYHFKLSPDPTDTVTAKDCHALAEQLAGKLFKDQECVISTHTDTPIVHTHIIVNAVNFETGKKLNIRNHAYGKMKDRANELGAERGMSVIDFRKRAERVKVPQAAEELREVIDEAMFMTDSMTDFKAHLRKYGVVVRETRNTISYLHPKRKKPIRGDKLGEQYTKGAILNGIEKQGNRGAAEIGGSAYAEGERKGKGVRGHSAEAIGSGSIADAGVRDNGVERAVRAVNERVRNLTPEGKREQEKLGRETEQKSVRTPEPQQSTPVQHRPKSKGIER